MSVSDELQRLDDRYRSGGLSGDEYRMVKAQLLGEDPLQSAPQWSWAPPDSSQHEGPYKPQGLRRLGKWLSSLMWVGVGLGVVALLVLALAISAYAGYGALGTEASAVAADRADATYLALSAVHGFWIIVPGVMFIVWLYRVYRQACEVTSGEFSWRPGWAIGGWFVPFLNLYLPYRLTADVSRSVTGSVRATVGIWWAFAIGGIVLGRVSGAILAGSDPLSPTFYVLALFEEFAYIGSGIAGALLVQQLTRGIADASERADQPAAPSPPLRPALGGAVHPPA